MSITFKVLPGRGAIPTFAAWIARAEVHLKERLREHGVEKRLPISMVLNRVRTHEPQPLDLQRAATWKNDEYAFFMIGDEDGGIDAHVYANTAQVRTIMHEELARKSSVTRLETLDLCLSQPVHFGFRRSAGQPILVVLMWGMLGAALAELTDGLITSDEAGPWEYRRWPATASEFVSWYLRPELIDANELSTMDMVSKWATSLREASARLSSEGAES